jgi:hypothetical protein
MSLDLALALAYMLLASALLAAMAGKRIFRSAPVFFAYLCFDLASTAAALAISRSSGFSAGYLRFFLFAYAGDLLLYLCALAELGKNLLRFNRNSHPHWEVAVLLFAGAAVVTGVLSRWAVTPGRSWLANACFLGLRIDGDLHFAGFLALAGWSGLRKFRWPEREWRIANGFGFVAFVWFLVSLLQYEWSTGPVYQVLGRTTGVSTMVALGYWLNYFWIEAEREPAARAAAAGPDLASNRNRPEDGKRLGNL